MITPSLVFDSFNACNIPSANVLLCYAKVDLNIQSFSYKCFEKIQGAYKSLPSESFTLTAKLDYENIILYSKTFNCNDFTRADLSNFLKYVSILEKEYVHSLNKFVLTDLKSAISTDYENRVKALTFIDKWVYKTETHSDAVEEYLDDFLDYDCREPGHADDWDVPIGFASLLADNDNNSFIVIYDDCFYHISLERLIEIFKDEYPNADLYLEESKTHYLKKL